VQEEITQSFEYLENEDYGGSQHSSSSKKAAEFRRIPSPEAPLFPEPPRRLKQELNAMAVGKTSFAERVRIFQSLGISFYTRRLYLNTVLRIRIRSDLDLLVGSKSGRMGPDPNPRLNK
jgi:hypothetical protein